MTKVVAGLVVLLAASIAETTAVVAGVRVSLSHVDAKGNFTSRGRALRAFSRDVLRVSTLKGVAGVGGRGGASAPVYAGGGAYLMEMAIGTPAVSFTALADTGSDLVWTRCAGGGTTFDPERSPTFAKLPCDGGLCSALPRPACTPADCAYTYTYGLGSTRGVLATDTITLSTTTIAGVAFGCSNWTSSDFDGIGGIAGLGRGNLSLVSQLGVNQFSYCFTSFDDAVNKSLLIIGNNNTSSTSPPPSSSTPFVSNPSRNHYYISLTGISLGSMLLAVAPATFALNGDGSGGMIIDSGTTYTLLADEAFATVGTAVQALLSGALQPANGTASVGLEYCFAVSSAALPAMPAMTFHFAGAGGDMALPASNYMQLFEEAGLWCLAMWKSSVIGRGIPQIFGVYQQQNMQFVYDLAAGLLSFSPAQCSSL